MSIIQAYKSDQDGKLFEDKGKYQRHLRKLAAIRRQDRMLKKMELERQAFLDTMGQVKDFDELQDFIRTNWKWFFMNGMKREGWHLSAKERRVFHNLTHLTFKNTYYTKDNSNSHSCPRGGVTNWYSYNDAPVSYPGWSGRIHIVVKPDNGSKYAWGSSYFDNTPINTGSGGGGGVDPAGNIHYEYDFKIWGADFPVMYREQCIKDWIEKENKERQYVWRQLGGTANGFSLITDVPEGWVCPDPLVGRMDPKGRKRQI